MAMSLMNPGIVTRSGRCWLAAVRTSASVASTRSRNPIRLRPSTVPVLPFTGTVPSLMMVKASIAVLSRLRISCATRPRRSSSSFALASALSRACSVTASAMAVSRQRLRTWNSWVVMGIFCSTAISVTA